MSKSVLVAMSGGVDSSVAAYLLKEQGYDVTGVTMRLCDDYYDNDDFYGEEPTSNGDKVACDLNSVEQNQEPTALYLAHSIADKLCIPFMVVDYRTEFKYLVINPFVEAYESGKTPNPCTVCNKCLKFDKLLDDSDEGYEECTEDAPMLATGHYARIEYADGRWKLRKATYLQKDQSYFLYQLSQDTLSRVLFPLGSMTKDEVREIAAKQCFENARNNDSQDICFIPDGDYYTFIKNYTGNDYPEGNFVDMQGNVLGRHKGIIKYTVGQRKGLGLALKKPMYVYKLDVEKNEVVLADNSEVFSKSLMADDVNWVSMSKPTSPFRALGRIRYRHKEAACTVTPNEDGTMSVEFDEPQRAITAGQSFVLYDIETDSYVLGGGTII